MSDQPTPPEQVPGAASAETPNADQPVAPQAQPETPAPAVEAPATMSESAAPMTQPAPASKRGGMQGGYYWGTGRRKTAIARVRVKPGSGKFVVNKKEIDHYFCTPRDRKDVVAPLEATKSMGKFDVFVNVRGGGSTGQAGAVTLGLARALLKADPELEPALRDGSFLTRDSRKVERKKPGQPGARKRFQFSKR